MGNQLLGCVLIVAQGSEALHDANATNVVLGRCGAFAGEPDRPGWSRTGLHADGRCRVKWQARGWQGVVAVLLFGVAALAGAQDGVPAPADSYPDEDAAAVRPDIPDPQDRNARRNLDRVLRLNPENVPARVLNGWTLLQDRGARSRGYDAFEDAIDAAPPGSLALRHAHWNYAWALFAGAETTRAMEHWQAAAQLHGGHPSWVPTTFALGSNALSASPRSGRATW